MDDSEKLEVIDQNKEDVERQWKNADFLNRHKLALEQWSKTHPGIRPPIIEDKDGLYRWVNRTERRKMGRKK